MPPRRWGLLGAMLCASRRVSALGAAAARAGPRRALSELRAHSAELDIDTPERMEALGGVFGAAAGRGDAVLLRGDLGAGKTCFARGFVRARTADARLRVTSPSYLLDNAYDTDDGLIVHHMDLYRLADDAALFMLNFPTVLQDCACVIEWPNKLGVFMPAQRLDVEILAPDDERRSVSLNASTLPEDHAFRAVVERLLRDGAPPEPE
ncbi:hypothetical protein M885DRAFT_517314 [Pelagophyceae sp. CCMP2097]|nr:hypothetical protein M885DRAFT_517314 [Pelagophyceae sp. CCMP2097]